MRGLGRNEMESWIVKKCINMLWETIVAAMEQGLVLGVVVSLVVGVLINIYFKKEGIKIKQIPFFISILYIFFVLWLTIFSRPNGQYNMGISVELYFIHDDWYSILQTAQNLLLTLPLGIFVTYFFKKLRIALLIGALFSLCIECIQLITGRGTFEISDFIMNTVGALVGGFLYIIANNLLKMIVRCCFKSRIRE